MKNALFSGRFDGPPSRLGFLFLPLLCSEIGFDHDQERNLSKTRYLKKIFRIRIESWNK